MMSYKAFLDHMQEQLIDCLADGENLSWHHLPEGDPRFQLMLRLSTWLNELEWRRVRFGNTHKAIRQRNTEQGRLPWTEDRVAGYLTEPSNHERLADGDGSDGWSSGG